MAIRFRKSINLGLAKINFGKTGFTSVTIGGRGLSLSIGRRGVYFNLSIRGTGLSFRKCLYKPKRPHKPVDNSDLNGLLKAATKKEQNKGGGDE